MPSRDHFLHWQSHKHPNSSAMLLATNLSLVSKDNLFRQKKAESSAFNRVACESATPFETIRRVNGIVRFIFYNQRHGSPASFDDCSDCGSLTAILDRILQQHCRHNRKGFSATANNSPNSCYR